MDFPCSTALQHVSWGSRAILATVAATCFVVLTCAPAGAAPLASPTPSPVSSTPDALPVALKWAMAVLAFVGVVVGLGVASWTAREHDEYDTFIG